jgi:2-C-methyl-D-erythritol 4-phosphate cytidylyltransferase
MLSAIVVAAGKGNRFNKGRLSKVILNINLKPVIYYSLSSLDKHYEVDEIIVVASHINIKDIARIVKKYKLSKVKKIVLGGRRRQDSVLNGLNAIDKKSKFVLIHDGARPFLRKSLISSLVFSARKFNACVSAVPIKATIKKADSNLWVKKTIDRKGLWEIQTPQVFRKEILLKAYEKSRGLEVTDDAMLVENLGVRVKLVMGSYSNIKLTTPEDLVIAELLAKNKETFI